MPYLLHVLPRCCIAMATEMRLSCTITYSYTGAAGKFDKFDSLVADADTRSSKNSSTLSHNANRGLNKGKDTRRNRSRARPLISSRACLFSEDRGGCSLSAIQMTISLSISMSGCVSTNHSKSNL